MRFAPYFYGDKLLGMTKPIKLQECSNNAVVLKAGKGEVR